MIESFRLVNYKIFADTKTIHIKPLTLLLGKNNSGKSSLLKALSFMKEALAQGENSVMSVKPAEGVRMGETMRDMFHRRELVDLGFIVDFTDNIHYSVRLLTTNGNVRPYIYDLQIGEDSFLSRDTVPSQDLYKELAGLFPLRYKDSCEQAFRFNVRHIGPLRVIPPELIPVTTASDSLFVGYDGKATYGILLFSFLQGTPLFRQVSKWFRENMEGISLQFSPINPSGTAYVLNVEHDGVAVNIVDVGLGVAQLLPIITQSFIPEKDTIVALEQPVLHLHPAAHASVAERLAEASLQTGVRFIVESHSKNFLLGLRLEAILPDNPFSTEDAAIYYVDNEELPANVNEIKINPDGSLTYWPTGIFGEDADLMDKIMDQR